MDHLWQTDTLFLIAAIFVLAGFVKGVIGMGLPTVSLGLLTATLGLKAAIVLMLFPAFMANVWQSVSGGGFLTITRRLWPLLLAACLGIALGANLFARADATVLSGVLGILIFIYALVGLATPHLTIPDRWERWLTPAVGAANGVFTGLTGSYVFPAVPYLQALGLKRDALIQSMGILFLVSTIALAVALAGHQLLPADMGTLSIAAFVPAFLGMAIGQWVRRRISEVQFRWVFFAALLALGAYIGGTAFL